MTERFRCAATIALAISAGLAMFVGLAMGQTTGFLRVEVSDQSGAARAAICELTGGTLGHFDLRVADANGVCQFSDLASGPYSLRVVSAGFRPSEESLRFVEGQTITQHVTLRLLGANTSIQVDGAASDSEADNAEHLGRDQLDRRAESQPARQLVDVVRQQPGWTIEANGVLHPRGSEYDTQYIVDGVPILENVSPAFAPPLDLSDVEDLQVQTGGYPASEGRKLGGVITVNTRDDQPQGWHGAASLDGGSFGTAQVALAAGIGSARNSLWVDASGSRTDRFLDPPTLENFTNHGTTRALDVAIAHQFSAYKRLRISLRGGRTDFEVPNEIQQQAAGQQQGRGVEEFSAVLGYQQVLSPNWLLDVNASWHSLVASLSSNQSSTPILPQQKRSSNDAYGSTAVTGHHGRNEVAFGVDFLHTDLREDFRYTITNPAAFDADVLDHFGFAQNAVANEAAGYAQDHLSAGPVTANFGLRWDYYNLVTKQTAWSPRLALAYDIRSLGIVLRAAYDRVFDIPATENLLLASSPSTHTVNPGVVGLAVPPAHANFFEVGAGRSFAGGGRVEVSAFRRDFRNYQDDDVFLNTGVSFPISFASALIEGIEARIHVPLSHRVVIDSNFSNLSGTARLPVTGGLFLDGGAQLLHSNETFRITQDQRSTASWQLQVLASRRLRFGCNGWYGSGMPVELDAGSAYTADPRITQRVNFARERLRPSLAVGIFGAAQVWKRETHSLEAQFGIDNLTDHLNVINFAGLFSGTAIGAPRSLQGRLKYQF